MTSLIRLGNLDFADIKASIKKYLSEQTEFTDYNFEGAGLTQLVNVLAYNAHYDSLSANFLVNEIFLDTAVKRSSVVSRAKELGYIPRSSRAATTNLTVSMSNITHQSNTSAVVLPAGTRFSTTINSDTFTFTTRQVITLNETFQNGIPVYTNSFDVYEGVLTQHTTVFDKSRNIISIPNLDVDTSTLKVEVWENGAWVEYVQPQHFLSVNSTSAIYMVQEGFNGFEIYFGDGVLGKIPTNGTNIRLTYVITSGVIGNGAINFTLMSNIDVVTPSTVIRIVAATASSSGQAQESIDSIRNNAKITFSSQNRAVTPDDYAAIALQNFPQILDVIAWSGSDNIPPQYGRVILCVEPVVGDTLLPNDKINVTKFLQTKGVGNIGISYVDPDYLNVIIKSVVKYNINTLQVGTYELQYIINAAITKYMTNNIQKFKGVLRYSQLLSAIDSADYSITGNETSILLSKVLGVNLYTKNNFLFSFSNSMKAGTLSSSVYYDGITQNQLYLKDLNGGINVYYSSNGLDVLYLANVGTVNYTTGEVIISNLSVASLNSLSFNISMSPVSQNIYSSKNVILRLNQSDLNISVVKDTTL